MTTSDGIQLMSYLIIMSGFIFFSSGHKGRDREQEITAVLPLPGCRDACTLLSLTLLSDKT